MDENKLNNEVNKAHRAKTILEDPLFKEAFTLLKDEYQAAMLATKHNEDDQRKALWQAWHITSKVENHFRTAVETGKLATVQLNQLKNNG